MIASRTTTNFSTPKDNPKPESISSHKLTRRLPKTTHGSVHLLGFAYHAGTVLKIV